MKATTSSPKRESKKEESSWTAMPVCVPGEIQTFSGKKLSVLAPDPDAICIEDIAHALAWIPRFGGHTIKGYTVAEHSVRVAEILPPELKLAGLLHDASEAYIGDVQTPVKMTLPGYYRIENDLMAVIAQKFGFEWPLHPDVVLADRLILELEWNALMGANRSMYGWGALRGPFGKDIFMKNYYEFTNKNEK